MKLTPTNESKEIIEEYEELCNKIKDSTRSISKHADDYDERYMKIKFKFDDKLALNKTIEIHNETIVVRDVFKKITNVICKFSDIR